MVNEDHFTTMVNIGFANYYIMDHGFVFGVGDMFIGPSESNIGGPLRLDFHTLAPKRCLDIVAGPILIASTLSITS